MIDGKKTCKWSKNEVSDICELIVDCVNKTAPKVENVTPYKMLRTTNIKKGQIDTKNCFFVTKDTFEKWTRRATVDKGDVLLTREAPMGEVGFVNYNDNTFLGQRIMQYRADNKRVLSGFLYYSFLSPYVQKQIKRFNNGGSTVSHIRVPDCSKFLIRFPSIEKQRQITKILSDIDKKIEINNKINTELESMAKLIYDYWFVQFDFPDSKGKPYKSSGGKMIWNEELKREIPEGWEVKRLSELISSIFRGISPKYTENGGVCVLNQKCIRNRSVLFEFSRRHDHNNKGTQKKIEIYDVLVNSTGVGTLGRVAIMKRFIEEFITVDSHVTIVRADINKINKLFFSFSILNKQPEIERFSLGSTGQVELSRNQLESIKIITPNRNLQNAFSYKYEKIIQRMANCETENSKLVQLRDWLLPMLMNGQVTVGGSDK